MRRCNNGFPSAGWPVSLNWQRQKAMEVLRVDLTVKLNMLAVCAAFVFVGAVLLGAF
jgi:hypothetical protein